MTSDDGTTQPDAGGPRTVPIEFVEPSVRLVPIPHQQETARKRLAYCLVAIMAFEVLFACLALFVANYFEVTMAVKDVTEIMVVIFGPTVALVGSATGFYFGTRAGQTDAATPPG